MRRKNRENKNVLVAVLKSRRDRIILLCEKWYRIPCDTAPKRTFRYIAFYQPQCFGREGKRIAYYARVARIEKHPRRVLLPCEQNAPTANRNYLKIYLRGITRLPRPIINNTPRRISFGFTTLARLKKSRTILGLYRVASTEEMVGKALAAANITAISQYVISEGKGDNRRRYRLDFAIVHQNKKIAIECDNKKAHSTAAQKKKDSAKDAFLRCHGWMVIRLSEPDILFRLDWCLARIRNAITPILAERGNNRKKNDNENDRNEIVVNVGNP